MEQQRCPVVSGWPRMGKERTMRVRFDGIGCCWFQDGDFCFDFLIISAGIPSRFEPSRSHVVHLRVHLRPCVFKEWDFGLERVFKRAI